MLAEHNGLSMKTLVLDVQMEQCNLLIFQESVSSCEVTIVALLFGCSLREAAAPRGACSSTSYSNDLAVPSEDSCYQLVFFRWLLDQLKELSVLS